MPKATEAEIVLLQILLLGVIAVVGTLLVLFQIVWHLRNEEKSRIEVLRELRDAYQKENLRKQRRERI